MSESFRVVDSYTVPHDARVTVTGAGNIESMFHPYELRKLSAESRERLRGEAVPPSLSGDTNLDCDVRVSLWGPMLHGEVKKVVPRRPLVAVEDWPTARHRDIKDHHLRLEHRGEKGDFSLHVPMTKMTRSWEIQIVYVKLTCEVDDE